MKKRLETLIDLLLIILCAALGCALGMKIWEVML